MRTDELGTKAVESEMFPECVLNCIPVQTVLWPRANQTRNLGQILEQPRCRLARQSAARQHTRQKSERQPVGITGLRNRLWGKRNDFPKNRGAASPACKIFAAAAMRCCKMYFVIKGKKQNTLTPHACWRQKTRHQKVVVAFL